MAGKRGGAAKESEGERRKEKVENIKGRKKREEERKEQKRKSNKTKQLKRRRELNYLKDCQEAGFKLKKE